MDALVVVTKTCAECGQEKTLDKFPFRKDKGIYRGRCVVCHNAHVNANRKRWRADNPDKRNAEWRRWRAKHREYHNLKMREYRAAHPEMLKEMNRRYSLRKKKSPKYRLLINLRRRVLIALERARIGKSQHHYDMIGCSGKELMEHLERQFKLGMSWENYGKKGWHVDHIIPCSRFDLSDPEQQRRCFHFTNMRPLWWWENLSKGCKVA